MEVAGTIGGYVAEKWDEFSKLKFDDQVERVFELLGDISIAVVGIAKCPNLASGSSRLSATIRKIGDMLGIINKGPVAGLAGDAARETTEKVGREAAEKASQEAVEDAVQDVVQRGNDVTDAVTDALPDGAGDDLLNAVTDRAGQGGGLPYIENAPDPSVINQSLDNSCTAACTRQILLDRGIADIPEADIVNHHLTKYIPSGPAAGADPVNVAKAANELVGGKVLTGGTPDVDDYAQVAATLTQHKSPWSASLKTSSGSTHAVIVDSIDEGIVSIRDPWGLSGPGSGSGTRATMATEDFLDAWKRAGNRAIF